MAVISHLLNTVPQRVLALLVRVPDREYYARQIADTLGTSPAAAIYALKALLDTGAVKRRRTGRMSFYSAAAGNPVLFEFKKLVTLLLLEPLVERLRRFSSRIILYGSAARGNDTSASDIDLFIMTRDSERALNLIHSFHFPRGFDDIRIQPVVRTPLEILTAGEDEQTFMAEVERGIVLWEKSDV